MTEDFLLYFLVLLDLYTCKAIGTNNFLRLLTLRSLALRSKVSFAAVYFFVLDNTSIFLIRCRWIGGQIHNEVYQEIHHAGESTGQVRKVLFCDKEYHEAEIKRKEKNNVIIGVVSRQVLLMMCRHD